MKRPGGITALSCFMLMVGLGGALHTWANLTQPWDGVLFSPVNGLLAFCTAVTGFTSAVGFWRMKTWAVQAYISWLGVLAVQTLVVFMGPFDRMKVSVVALIKAVLVILVLRYARCEMSQHT